MDNQVIVKNNNNYNMLAAAFILLFCSSADIYAADWASIKKTKDYELLVDMDSYNVSQGLPFITAKKRFNSPKKIAFNGYAQLYIEEQAKKLFNCKLQSYRVLETSYFKKKNILIGTEKGVNSFIKLKPASDDATTANLVCQVHKMLGGL
jgi:hypothetical protein